MVVREADALIYSVERPCEFLTRAGEVRLANVRNIP